MLRKEFKTSSHIISCVFIFKYQVILKKETSFPGEPCGKVAIIFQWTSRKFLPTSMKVQAGEQIPLVEMITPPKMEKTPARCSFMLRQFTSPFMKGDCWGDKNKYPERCSWMVQKQFSKHLLPYTSTLQNDTRRKRHQNIN